MKKKLILMLLISLWSSLLFSKQTQSISTDLLDSVMFVLEETQDQNYPYTVSIGHGQTHSWTAQVFPSRASDGTLMILFTDDIVDKSSGLHFYDYILSTPFPEVDPVIEITDSTGAQVSLVHQELTAVPYSIRSGHADKADSLKNNIDISVNSITAETATLNNLYIDNLYNTNGNVINFNQNTTSTQNFLQGNDAFTVNGTFASYWGNPSEVSGYYSTAFGQETTATGENSTAFGFNTIAGGANSLAIGKFNIADNNSLFIIGNGTDTNNRNNVVDILADHIKLNQSVTISSNLQVNHAIKTNAALTAQGNISTEGSLKVMGDAQLQSLNVTDNMTIKGNSQLQSLNITDNMTIHGNIAHPIKLDDTNYVKNQLAVVANGIAKVWNGTEAIELILGIIVGTDDKENQVYDISSSGVFNDAGNLSSISGNLSFYNESGNHVPNNSHGVIYHNSSGGLMIGYLNNSHIYLHLNGMPAQNSSDPLM